MKTNIDNLESNFTNPDTTTQENNSDNNENLSVENWANAIKTALTSQTKNAIEIASVIARAKEQLERGDWSLLCSRNDLGQSKRKMDMLATVGTSLGNANEQMFAHLPPGWTVLYQLSLIPRQLLLIHIERNEVHPKLKLKDAKLLVAKFRGIMPEKREPDLLGYANRIEKYFAEHRQSCSLDQRTKAKQKLADVWKAL